jgi:hypothetical protein
MDNEPNLYLNLEEIERLKSRATSKNPLWQKLWGNYVEEAEEALTVEPNPVVGDFDPGEVGVYRDGHPNASWKRENYYQLIWDCKRVRSMGLVYAVEGREECAERIGEYVDAWVTHMHPRIGGGHVLEAEITVPAMIWGMDLCRSHKGWADARHDAFCKWLAELVAGIENFRPNNHGDWANHFCLAVGSYSGRDDIYHFGIDGADHAESFVKHIGASMTDEGVLPLEKKRANGYGYSSYTLDAWCLTAEVARHRGDDLYNKTVNGKNIQLAMQFHAGFFTGEKSAREFFDSDMTVEQKGEPSSYELGVKTWPDDEQLKSVLRAVGRESWEKRILGWPALTHGVDEVG